MELTREQIDLLKKLMTSSARKGNLANKGVKVFASDVSSEEIKIAEEKSKGLNITYSVYDATDFSGFEDSKFEVVVMSMVIHYIKDLDKLFSGISRILKSGGIFS